MLTMQNCYQEDLFSLPWTSEMIEKNEFDIEKEILDYLGYIGFPMKINLGAKPIKIGGKIELRPFRSKYYH